jgi:TonB family protein
MHKKTTITAALFGFLLLLCLFSPLRSEEKSAPPASPSPADQRDASLRDLDQRLQKRQWNEAYELSSRLVDEWRGSLAMGMGPYLGRSLMGLALSEAGLGHEADALWHWQMAQNLGGVDKINLSIYGPPGEMLAAHRLRWWEEPPQGMTVLAAGELGSDGTPPRKLSGSDLKLTGPLAKLALPKWAWLQMVVDKDGRVVEPVVLAGSIPGVELAALEAVRDWRFEPARRGGEPVATYLELTLPPRREAPFKKMLVGARMLKANDCLLAGDWQCAHTAARAAWLENIGKSHPKAGDALALVALAEAGMGEKETAICHWQVAQTASPNLYDADLSAYGENGQLLADHPWGGPRVRPTKSQPEPRRLNEETGSLTRPRKISGAPPQFPSAARQPGLTGNAIVEAIIDETGHVTNVRLLKNLSPGLDLAAMDAVCGWRYEPATFEGKPVKVYYSLTVNYAVVSP